jgi:hypothetical protein
MFIYTVSLAAGDTLNGAVVKTATMRGYLNAASEFIKTAGQRQECPLEDPRTGKWHRKIERELQDFERWEKMPNRKDPLTKKMVRALAEMAKGTHEDSKEHAFLDWCIVGLHMGYRRCEWASEKNPKHSEDFPRAQNPTKEIYQVLVDDFRILGEGGARITDDLTHPADKLSAAVVTVRFQKNGDHGQKITQAANTADPQFCCVRAIQRIKQRAHRLGLSGPSPASAYRAHQKSRKPNYFYVRIIQQLLTRMAEKAYDCDAKEAGLSYTGHSLRIGATVILYCGGARDTEIQHRIRWRSLSFLTYLRDVPRAAINHMMIVNAPDVESWM